MDKDRLIEQLMGTFLEELKEHVRTLNRDLLALEKAPSPEARAALLGALFRAAHSLKGAARSVGVGPIEECCHHLEDLLASLRDARRAEDPALFELLFAVVDAVERAGPLLAGARGAPLAELTALAPRLKAASVPGSPELAAAGAVRPAPAAAQDGFVRVPVAKLDLLQSQSGELLVARRRLAGRFEELSAACAELDALRLAWRGVEKAALKELPVGGRAAAGLAAAGERLARTASAVERLSASAGAELRGLAQAAQPLEESARAARMLPFLHAAEGLDRSVRDLAKSGGKEAEASVAGAEVELDRAVLEALKPALLHLVRNAVDHGLETPEGRRRAGKPPAGRVSIAAALRGARVEVSVEDDGRGVDLEAVRARARNDGLEPPEDPARLAELILGAGFSTAAYVTDLSGRGVGLDAVRGSVEALGGALDFSSEPGRGTRFVLSVPLTLTTVRALLLSSGGAVFAAPVASVRGLARVGAADLRPVEGRETVLFEGAPVPLCSLADALGLAAREPSAPGGKACVMILRHSRRQAAFLVDELLSEEEIVVKSLGSRLRKAPFVSGAAVLATGRIALILDAQELVEKALGRSPTRPLAAALAEPVTETRKRILVVEDSVTTRSLEKSILESAGYEVATAADGAEAWRLLQEGPFELVVSDIEMPRMDGFALVEAVRGSKRLRDLPVVLVTALEKDEEKAKGLQAGADAYLRKSAFDQRLLLETIGRLL